MTCPKFGDIVRGIYASESNPLRDGIFVETITRTGKLNRGVHYRMTDGKGEFWTTPRESTVVVSRASLQPNRQP